MTVRSAAYLRRFKDAGGRIVSVRMTAEQFAQLNRLRREGESATACVNRLVTLTYAYAPSLDERTRP